MKIDLKNKEFIKALDIVEYSYDSLYLTGKAGTGKSTLLRHIMRNCKKKMIFLAPTGIAALNIKGMTIHSFFQLPFGPILSDDPRLTDIRYSRQKKNIIKKLNLVVIDEVSMCRADIIDAIDYCLRNYGGDPNKAFGGKQMLFVGDPFQLEPVVTPSDKLVLAKTYETAYFFSSSAYKEAFVQHVELKKVYRQHDTYFINLLDKIRTDNITQEELGEVNYQYTEEENTEDFSILLSSLRKIADDTNRQKLNELTVDETVFQAQLKGAFSAKNYPTDLALRLKIGAQVMFIRNDVQKQWVNGSIGKIVGINKTEIQVELETGKTVSAEAETWDNLKYYLDDDGEIKEEVLGSFTQIPLRLAWAITIHKSQGLTFENVIIDLGNGAFSAGQTYVALSRCTSLEGITLRTPIRKKDIIVRREVLDFIGDIRYLED